MEHNNPRYMAGVDEAGRGPLAGPVVAAAVILNPNKPIVGLADSKKLSAKKRQELFLIIQENALAFAIASATVEEIDTHNILQASLLAMKRAIEKLSLVPHEVLVDGNQCPKIHLPVRAIIGGDDSVAEISAASILAKETRDAQMLNYHQEFPDYNFASHKGYPTREHLLALEKFGPTKIHRKTFGPVARLLPADYVL